jgi:tetratricopeptide (TPR) repeat protein
MNNKIFPLAIASLLLAIAKPALAINMQERGDLALNGTAQRNNAITLPFKIAQEDVINKLTKQADIAFKKKDFKSVIAIYTKVITLNPNLAIAYSYRGAAYKYLKDYPRALADNTKQISLTPSSALAYSNRGYTYMSLKDYTKAIADYDQALSIDPKLAVAYKGRGMAYFERGETQTAIENYTKAVAIDPLDADIFIRRAIAYSKIGDEKKARQDSLTAEQINRK